MSNTTLVNSIPFGLEFKDGRVEQVAYRQLEIGPLYTFLRAAYLHDSPALVAVCTGRPAAFFTGVRPKSFAKLASDCFTLNFPLALELADDPVAGAMIAPLLEQMATAAVAGENPALLEAMSKLPVALGKMSSASSSAPSPSASAAATGTGSSTPTPSSDSNSSSPSSAGIAPASDSPPSA